MPFSSCSSFLLSLENIFCNVMAFVQDQGHCSSLILTKVSEGCFFKVTSHWTATLKPQISSQLTVDVLKINTANNWVSGNQHQSGGVSCSYSLIHKIYSGVLQCTVRHENKIDQQQGGLNVWEQPVSRRSQVWSPQQKCSAISLW